MIRFSLTKLHAAFPELGVFSEADRKKYIRQAKRFQWGRRASIQFAAGFGVTVCMLVFLATVTWALNSMSFVPGTVVTLLLGGLYITAMVGVPLMTFLIARDTGVRHAIKYSIDLSRCPACHHSLIGLSPTPDQTSSEPVLGIRCPECGTHVPVSIDEGQDPASLVIGKPGIQLQRDQLDLATLHPLVARYRQLAGLPTELQSQAISCVESTRKQRQVRAVGLGLLIASVPAGICLLVLHLGLGGPVAGLKSLINPGTWAWMTNGAALLIFWCVAAWSKRIVRSILTALAVDRAIGEVGSPIARFMRREPDETTGDVPAGV